jgi:hypothetical protein
LLSFVFIGTVFAGPQSLDPDLWLGLTKYELII